MRLPWCESIVCWDALKGVPYFETIRTSARIHGWMQH
jgi:hypothetical protein